jgi:glycosyltransferase involved in cell wall biosynthesis
VNVNFSIITPSFRNSEWLKLCIASVADQEGVAHEHIVQDSCSDDGTQDWLPKDPRVKAFIEKDSGMYDAVNRGLKRASGELLAYLNCDEEYLPGALAAVAEVFQRHPDTDVVFADTVVVDPEGKYLCSRKCMVPWRGMAWIFNPTITSSIFFHRRVVHDFNLLFDVRYRDLSDTLWTQEALQLGLRMRNLRRYTSTFTETGDNMNLRPNAMRERALVRRRMPGWVRAFRWPLLQTHRVRAALNRIYWDQPFTYSLYTKASPARRVDVSVDKPTGIWWQRHQVNKEAISRAGS